MKAHLTTSDVEKALNDMLTGIENEVAQEGGRFVFEGATKASDPVAALKQANNLAQEIGYEEVVDRLLGSLADLV